MELEEFIAGADGYGAALLKELGFIRHFIGALFQDIIAGSHQGLNWRLCRQTPWDVKVITRPARQKYRVPSFA